MSEQSRAQNLFFCPGTRMGGGDPRLLIQTSPKVCQQLLAGL